MGYIVYKFVKNVCINSMFRVLVCKFFNNMSYGMGGFGKFFNVNGYDYIVLLYLLIGVCVLEILMKSLEGKKFVFIWYGWRKLLFVNISWLRYIGIWFIWFFGKFFFFNFR